MAGNSFMSLSSANEILDELYNQCYKSVFSGYSYQVKYIDDKRSHAVYLATASNCNLSCIHQTSVIDGESLDILYCCVDIDETINNRGVGGGKLA